MIDVVVGSVTSFIITVIDTAGYPGIFLLMAIEGSFIVLPSEIILPFAGFLASEGRFSIIGIAFVGALGNIAGTLFSYSVARYVGLPFLYRFGKYVLVTRHDIDLAQRLFTKYGVAILFASRLIPGIRGFIPIPAGIAKNETYSFCCICVCRFSCLFICSYIYWFCYWRKLGYNWSVSASISNISFYYTYFRSCLVGMAAYFTAASRKNK